jgi:hypothetical protein
VHVPVALNLDAGRCSVKLDQGSSWIFSALRMVSRSPVSLTSEISRVTAAVLDGGALHVRDQSALLGLDVVVVKQGLAVHQDVKGPHAGLARSWGRAHPGAQ